MDNVVTAIFEVESEAYKAFTELRNKPFGDNYAVAEASLLKRDGDNIVVSDSFDASGVTEDDTAAGMVIGSLLGILGGPLGVILGASAGALIGSISDTDDAIDSVSMLQITAAKLYDGEVAIIALVQEEEPAFDAAFANYQTTIIRHFAADVMDEVDLARDAAKDFENQLNAELKAERKAERAEKRAERKAEREEKRAARIAKMDDRFEKLEAKRAERKAERAERKSDFDESADIAEAEFVNSTKEMLGTK